MNVTCLVESLRTDLDIISGEKVTLVSMCRHAVPSTPHICGIASTANETLFQSGEDSDAVRDFTQSDFRLRLIAWTAS